MIDSLRRTDKMKTFFEGLEKIDVIVEIKDDKNKK